MVIAPTVEDTAVYECEVTNEAGNQTRSIDLTVQGERTCTFEQLHAVLWQHGYNMFFHILYTVLPTVPPSIADEPTELTVTRLSPVVIACTASGVPEPSIHWSKDGMKLPQEGQGFNILPTGQLQNRTFLC